MGSSGAGEREIFHFVMIKPTHYDNEGYPIQWLRSAIPSNTLAVLNGLAVDCQERFILGPDVDIRLHTYDETNTHVPVEKIIRMFRRDGNKGVVGLVGVQSNQFPRAMDMARRFIAGGVKVAAGGFHVSGCIAMLKELPGDLKEALGMGVTFFAGEAEEGRLDGFFRDAYASRLKPIYNYMKDLPTLVDQPTPILAAEHLKGTAGSISSVDLGRGCPFQCSFCTIINVQGRKSRYRSPDDLEKMVRANVKQGITRFFITDDNFARNREWEALFDRLIHLRENEGMKLKFLIQVDTLCHKIPGFIDKAVRAGVSRVFIGLENVNPDNLAAAKKAQNKITEYRRMLQMWKAHGVTTYAGYILGFPNDTPQSLLKEVRIIQEELALDLVEFNILTPLPGSEDHQKMTEKGVWMDPDMNKYDLNHWVMKHPNMDHDQFMKAYASMWENYYSLEHMERIMRRADATGMSAGNMLFLMLWFYLNYKVEGVHPVEGGYFRLKYRKERRSGMPIESPFVFYPRYVYETIAKHVRVAPMVWKLMRIRKKIKKDPTRRTYRDLALTPVDDEAGSLSMYSDTRGTREALAHAKHVGEVVDMGKTAAKDKLVAAE